VQICKGGRPVNNHSLFFSGMMKKLRDRFLFLLAAALIAPASLLADYWTQKASYPGNGRSRAYCFSIDDKGYFGCGDQGGPYASDFWQYDTAANAWTQKASFGGGGRWSGVSFAATGFGFAGLGWSTTAMMSDLWKYDPVADSWTQMNNFPAGQRQLPASFVIGNKVYLSNGRNSGNLFQNDLWEYDPATDTWTQKSNVPGPARAQPFAFAMDGLGYVGGGFDQALNGLSDLYEYNPSTNAWTVKASIPSTGRGDPAGFAIGCMGYTGTGQTLPVNSVLDDFWEFNPALNQWISKAAFGGSARDESAFFAIGTKGYIGLGGVNGGSLTNDFWEYTPDTTCITVLPIASFTAPNHICPGTCTDFTNLSANGTSFLWTFPGGIPGTSTDVNPTSVCYAFPGTYAVSLIVTNAAGSDTLTLNNYITVYPVPPPQGITQSGDTLYGNAGAAGYQWYFDGLAIPGATNYFHVANASGDYNLVVTDANGCEAEAVLFDVIADLPAEGTIATQIKAFPNPATDHLFLFIPGSDFFATENKIHVYSVLGKRVSGFNFSSANTNAAGPRSSISLDVGALSNGVYWVEVSSGTSSVRIKFMKK
jgi:PKD repeat protein/N-acetylneuraminic acid mutarotase